MADFKIKSAAGTGNKTLIQGQDQSGSNYAIEIGDAGALKLGTITSGIFPNGHILQVISANKNAVQSFTGTSAENWQSVSDLTVNITPQTGNNVLVLVNLNVGGEQDYQNQARLYRGSTAISVGTASGSKLASSFMWRAPGGNHMFNWGGVYLDTSPGGDGSTAITYSIKVSGESNKTMYINRAYSESDAYNFGRQNSSITVMEVQA
jgi:hypothetical protein